MVSLSLTSPSYTRCTPRPEICMPCQHVVFNFSGRWIRRAVPAWWFWKFIAVDGFSVADVLVSHFVSHADTSGLPAPHLVPPPQDSKTHQMCPTFFLFNGLMGGPGLLCLDARPFQGSLRRLKPINEVSAGFHVRKINTPFSHATVCVLEHM